MTDPLSLATAGVAAGVSVVLGWMFWPVAPDLDGERWFKIQLSTLLLGHMDAAGQTADEWAEAVVTAVPYHPAGREPERKVQGLAPGTTAVEGERALCEKLAALPDAQARWAFMYDEDEIGLAARLDDPAELGPTYDPATALGPQAGWEALEAWGAGTSRGFPEALNRSLDAAWILCDGSPGEAPAVLDALEGLVRGSRVPFDGVDADGVVDAAAPWLRDPAGRVVLVGAGEGIQSILRALVADAGLRDRCLAVLSVGGALTDEANAEWMEGAFTHHKLDTEVTRLTPYFATQWLDRTADTAGAFGVRVAEARFPEPLLEAMTQEAVQVVDLGVLPSDSDPVLVAHGLFAVLGCWVGAHQSG